MTADPGDAGWGRTVFSVVDGWLFHDEGVALPSVLIVPLENPHLHDEAAWRSQLGDPVAHNGLVHVHRVGGRDIAVARPVLGGSGAAMLVDAAAHRGVRTVIGVGFCGGLVPEWVCGDVIVVDRALVHDGVSRAYAGLLHDRPGVVAADRELVGAAAAQLPRATVCSVDAVHLETAELLGDLVGRGAEAVDLEMSTVLTVASVRGVAATGVLTVSDVPVRGAVADGASLGPGAKRTLGEAIGIALAAP